MSWTQSWKLGCMSSACLAMGCWCFVLPRCFEAAILASTRSVPATLQTASPSYISSFLYSFFLIASAVSFNWKKLWPFIFNLHLGVYFSIDAKQWILSSKFQFMKNINQILVPILRLPPQCHAIFIALWPGVLSGWETNSQQCWYETFSPPSLQVPVGGTQLRAGQRKRSRTRAPWSSAVLPPAHVRSHVAIATCNKLEHLHVVMTRALRD